ncbi:MAG: DUF2927 domain-containing protein [Pseudomonadota bacterium]
MTKSFCVIFAACVFALAPEATGAAGGNRLSQEVYRGFFQTVFGLEYGGHADAHRVKRFATKVRFHVSDRSGRNRLPVARAFLKSLPQRIKHFRGTEVRDQANANFRLLIVRKADFAAVVRRELKADAIAMNARCLVGVNTQNGRIQRSTAIIVGDDDFLFPRCLVEEVLQGLGPMNDDPALTKSVFNDTSRHTTFTAFDQAILNVLYHPAIKPGMSGAEVHRAMPRALKDLGYR